MAPLSGFEGLEDEYLLWWHFERPDRTMVALGAEFKTLVKAGD